MDSIKLKNIISKNTLKIKRNLILKKNEYSKIVNVFGNTLSLLNAPLLET